MTTISIFKQISVYNIFGETGCIIFGLSIGIHEQLLIIGGFGMAIFRLFCIENWSEQIERQQLVRIIHLIQSAIIIITTTISIFGISYAGWEKNIMNQFCKDYGLVKADIYHSYHNYENQELGKYEKYFDNTCQISWVLNSKLSPRQQLMCNIL